MATDKTLGMLAAAVTADEERRLTLLRQMGVLDSATEDAFNGLVESAAQMLEMPIALVSLIDADRQWFKAAHGLALREMPREVSFCAHAIHGAELFEIEDAALDPRFKDNPFVTGDPHIRFYAGQPLSVDGVNLGTLCVIDTQPRRLDDRQRQVLKRLAAAAAELLAGRRRRFDLQEANQRLLDFARASGDWLWETDAELRYTFISAEIGAPPRPGAAGPVAAEHIAAGLIGQVMDDAALLDPHGQPQPGGWRRLLGGRVAFARALTERQIDGRRIHVSYSAVPVWGADGGFCGWRGSAQDVSASRRTALWARQQDLLLRRITAHVPGVIFRARRREDGLPQFLYLSPASEMLFGFSAEAACADPTLVANRVHRDDNAGVLAQLAAATRDVRPWRSEYRVVLSGGRTRWVETRALPEVAADGGVLWNGYTADITERKRAELALRQAEQTWELAAEADRIGIATIDLRSGRMTLDQRACANHGLAHPPADFTLDDWLRSLESDDRAPAREALRQAIEGRAPAPTCVRVRWPDAQVHDIEFVVAAATCDTAGQAVALVSTCRDVTDRLSLERLQREKDAADRASRAKSEFLSRASHELRTPLNSILGFTQLLVLDTTHPLHPDQLRQMQSVQHAGRHLLDLINDLLDLSRVESQEVVLSLHGVDLCAALGVCLDLLAPLARRGGVALPNAPAGAVHVHANARALEQLLMNLLSNAIKYNRRGGRVEIGLEIDAARVALAVRDEGLGMSASHQQRLFQPFERLGAERGHVEGSGLGLVIARELARAMGGSLDVASTPGVGSTFTLTLGVGDADDISTSFGSLIEAGPDTDAGTAAATPRVLYIEDDPLNVLLMQEVIRRVPPWSMTVADTGAEGLRAAREWRPDLLLIDINLPDMTGLEVIAALRSDPRTARLRCVALSADAMRDQIDSAMAAGFDDYWLKPIDVPRLIEQFGRLARSAPPR